MARATGQPRPRPGTRPMAATSRSCCPPSRSWWPCAGPRSPSPSSWSRPMGGLRRRGCPRPASCWRRSWRWAMPRRPSPCAASRPCGTSCVWPAPRWSWTRWSSQGSCGCTRSTRAHFLLFFVLPAEAALKFQLAGALGMWGGIAVIYSARQAWATATYGFQLSVPSIVYRLGILLIVTVILGLFALRLTRRTAELSETNDRLRREERWRTALIDMLAHDFRAPVGTAISSLEMIDHQLEAMSTEKVRRLLAAALRQSRRGLALADDLLTMARVRQDHLELHRRDVEVAALLQRVADGITDRSGDVRIEAPADLQASVDPARLEQIVTNLLSNARRYGRQPVVVRAQPLRRARTPRQRRRRRRVGGGPRHPLHPVRQRPTTGLGRAGAVAGRRARHRARWRRDLRRHRGPAHVHGLAARAVGGAHRRQRRLTLTRSPDRRAGRPAERRRRRHRSAPAASGPAPVGPRRAAHRRAGRPAARRWGCC